MPIHVQPLIKEDDDEEELMLDIPVEEEDEVIDMMEDVLSDEPAQLPIVDTQPEQ